MDRTEFVGVTSDPERGVASGNTGLYEFWTDKDEHVYLHDTVLVALTYRPGPLPNLTSAFQYASEWVPEELQGRPVVEISFQNVRVLQWEEDSEALAAMTSNPDAAAAAGQMSLLDWDGVRTFTLVTFAIEVVFTADRVHVRTTAAPER